ncbi:hypothetical protein DAPPUDRAFT_96706 [Daphnia pulex]|uniref:Uncharacterized protein n=1 Tax=Daphnia pulex TaxID=6669 RepID=E9FYN8_DAPPU|nr:hypothetical protein DAPPUDRAFT_96706 [Daphnia pulex]|eukprot:EFX87736.1 hypothetical protein DAPPUDRAFT_96706 [Daphnia pulex]
MATHSLRQPGGTELSGRTGTCEAHDSMKSVGGSCVVCVERLHHARDNQDQQRLDQEEEKNGEAKNDDGSPNKRSKRNLFGSTDTIPRTKSLMVFSFVGTDLQSARDQQIKWPNPYCKFASCLPKPSKTKEFLFARPIPIPSNVNLQKERHVKLVMQWCRGWTHPQKLQPAKGKGSPPVLHIRRSRRSLHETCHAAWCRGWVRTGRVSSFSSSYNSRKLSLMAGSTAGVAMSPWYGGNQTATPPPSYSTYATTSSCTDVFKYYTTKPREFYTTTYAAPSHYTDALKRRTAPHDYVCCPMLCPTPRLLSITLFSATYCTDFPKYYSVPSCYTEAPADVSTKTVEYYSAPIYITTTEAAKFYAVLTCYSKAALSCCVEQILH